MVEKLDPKIEAKPRSHHRRNNDQEDRSVDGSLSTNRGTGAIRGSGGTIATSEEIDTPRATSEASAETEAVISIEQPKRRKRGPNKPKSPITSAQTTEEVAKLVNLVTDAMNAVAVAVTNEREAAMNEGEQALFKPSLESTLKTVAPAMLEKVQIYSGPVGVLTALTLWGLRLAQLDRNQSSQGADDRHGILNDAPVEPPIPAHPKDGVGSLSPSVLGGGL